MIPATAARKRERPARDRPRDARDARRAQQHTIAGGSGASQDVQTVLEAIAAQHKSEVTDDADTSSKKERSPNTARPRDVQVYAVGEGDTLSKIAKKFYGSASRKHVMRIYDANRRVLKDVNSVRAGQELHIPNVKSKAHPQKPKPNKPDLRWYKVQPKDKYTTIAKAELGSARRWKEIHNLNKGTFPNPDRIRAGILIRLPSK